MYTSAKNIFQSRRIFFPSRLSNRNYNVNNNDNTCSDLTLFCMFNSGINFIQFYNAGQTQFDVDIVISYM